MTRTFTRGDQDAAAAAAEHKQQHSQHHHQHQEQQHIPVAAGLEQRLFAVTTVRCLALLLHRVVL